MCKESVIRGSAATASERDGWVVGHFMPEGLANRTDFEVKLWQYDTSLEYPPKSFGGTELIIVYGGVLRIWTICTDGSRELYVLDGKKRDYVILPPNVAKTVSVVTGPAFGVTVRSPSGEGINKIL